MAGSRTEDLFIDLIKGTKKDFEPQSRFESYMKCIINKADPAETPKPESRKDVLMKTYAEQVYNGGGGGGGTSKTSIKLNLSEFTFDETAQKFILSESAANTVLQIIQKAFELKGLCIAFLSIGETSYASYQINFSNELSSNVGYISFSNPLFTSEDLSANFNVIIKPQTTAQRICSDASLFNIFVENQGVLEFVFYSM